MKKLVIFALATVISLLTNAQEQYGSADVDSKHDTFSGTAEYDNPTRQRDGMSYSHFSWGADIGSSIDMTSQDMAAFDICAHFGYKSHFVRFAGIGAGIKSMVSNSSRSYPIYALFRSGFSSKPTLCFLDLKVGVSISDLHNTYSHTGLYGAIGLGFTLAKGKNFSSHITVGYEFIPLDNIENGNGVSQINNLHSALIRIGASF